MMKDTKNIINKYSFDRYELERNFDIEMEDETFKKLVSKLKLSKDELIKYTSRIKDASLELKNCANCKNIMECKNNICGYVYYPSVLQDNLVFSYVPCKYKKKLDNDTKYQDNIISFDMPKEIINASMKNIYTNDKNRLETIKWLTIFIKKIENKEELIKNINDRINTYIKQGYKSIAIIGKDMSECENLEKKLRTIRKDIKLIRGKDSEYNSGISIVPSYLAKGLEFDCVLLSDVSKEKYGNNSLDIKLLYVSITRAMSKLDVFYEGECSIETLSLYAKGINI